MAVGIQTMKVPSPGIKDMRLIKTPQTTAAGRPRNPEHDASQAALNERDGQASLQRGVYGVANSGEECILLAIVERQQRSQDIHAGIAVPIEKKKCKQHERDLSEGGQRTAQEATDVRCQKA